MSENGGVGSVLLGKSIRGKGSAGSRSSVISSTVVSRSGNGDLHGNFAPVDFLASERLEGLLLLLLVTNIYETVALATTGLTETAANDTSRHDVDTSLFEELAECSVINVEGKVCNEDDRLGWLAFGLFAFSAWGPWSTRLSNLLGSGRSLGGGSSALFTRCTSGLSFGGGLLGFGLALRNRQVVDEFFKVVITSKSKCQKGTYRLLSALLGLGLATSCFGGAFGSFAVGLGFSHLSWRSLVTATTGSTFPGTPLAPFLLFIFSRLGGLNDDLAAVKVLLVELCDSLVNLADVFDRNETVASRACAALNNLNRQTEIVKRKRYERASVLIFEELLSRGFFSFSKVVTYMSLTTPANNVFNPSSVVAYARLPTKI